MGAEDWYRASRWDARIAEEFEARLRRARSWNRAQYVGVQASCLLESADPSTRETGRGLLRRVIADYPDDDLRTKSAWEQLGDSLAHEGRLDEAELALREVLRRIEISPTGRSGTGVPHLRLAEVLIARGDPASIDEATELLVGLQAEMRSMAFLRDIRYRYLLACARAAHAQHVPEAAELARAALDVADDTSPTLPRHPTINRPQVTEADRLELESIAEPR